MRPSGSRRASTVSLPHFAGLDGLRGLAVAAVLLYHGGVSWAPGGLIGVEVFFVLSGFLITSLLLTEWARSATIVLRAFWARRARRLLPALFGLVLVIGVFYAVSGPTRAVPGLEGDGISTLLYFNNWHQIAEGASYFAASGPVSPFQHTWSLAIEEQFYLAWPILVLAVLGLTRRRGGSERRGLQILLGLSIAGIAGSATQTALLYGSGRGLDRIYYGTDTRAAGLLVGASLAIALALHARRRAAVRTGGCAAGDLQLAAPPRRGAGALQPAALTRRGAGALQLAAGAGLAAVAAGIGLVAGSTGWLYPYGMLGVDAAAAVTILAAVATPRGLAARLLSAAPLRGLGKISYGLYLWHFPLFLWLDQSATGLTGGRLLILRLLVSLGVSLVSFALIEQPIRQRRRSVWVMRGLAPIGAGAALMALLVASAAASLPGSTPAAAHLPRAPAGLTGHDGPCPVSLADTPGYGEAPVPPAAEARFEFRSLGSSTLVWSGTARRTFRTCPPRRVMVIGDSLAFTLGLPMMDDEQSYGVRLATDAVLGCSFATRGDLNVNGTWERPPAACPDALGRWARDERALHAQEVVIELGYRDEFDWRWGGRIVHLGQAAFDAYVQSQIDRYVRVLGRAAAKILFVSVPYTRPPAQADGAPAPAASRARHSIINGMLEREVHRHPRTVAVLDLDRTISPGDHYDARVRGQTCRFDGIHLSVFCAKLVEPRVLGEARALLAQR